MDWLRHHRRITHRFLRWNANSLLSGGLLALLMIGYLALVYVAIVAAGLLFGSTQRAPSASSWWMPGPWWLTGLGLAGFAASVWHVSRWLHRRVDDLVYGQHDNPYTLLSQLNQHLEGVSTPDALLPAVTASLAATLNLPYVAIETEGAAEGPTATYGEPPRQAEIVTIPLAYRTTRLGTLHVSARRPHERLSVDDTRLLVDLAHQVGITLHAAQLTEALQASREQLVLAREEERRRIRRDLHDGLGPTLASLRLQLSALRHTLGHSPDAVQLIDELRSDVRTATAEIRRLVYDLRPPMLDEFGLLGALRNMGLTSDGLQRSINIPATLPPLPAAVEVAIYRIAAEALHNITRHAQATRCAICLTLHDDRLTLTVTDNGCGLPATYLPGIGHRSMHERATELGGNVTILPAAAGGMCITATFPLKLVHDD
ncbi:MAG TPA: GAF domain-containing sensor histidine kinase [Roseiflexaceae bacterium]|nr:GAF domain-containing sensor histidine kinase [Roseiflexaceae bacterium]